MNILLIDCKKDADGSFRHTVFKCSHMNYKAYKEVIFDKFFDEIIEKEFIAEFLKDPKAYVERYI